ncbi:MAG: hypothetical protein WD226_08035 [Planctomycetota bacterium]
MPELSPYGFVRAVTLALATFWMVRGTLRTIGFARNWELRLYAWGLSRHWLRRQIAIVAVRATVLDPVNLALGFVLLALWIGPSRDWFRLETWRGVWAPYLDESKELLLEAVDEPDVAPDKEIEVTPPR